jgi:hypothetical protein
MYTEIVSAPNGVERLRKVIDPKSEHFTDENFIHILTTCSFMLDRAVVKCFLGLQEKARKEKKPELNLWARNMCNRFEAGILEV